MPLIRLQGSHLMIIGAFQKKNKNKTKKPKKNNKDTDFKFLK